MEYEYSMEELVPVAGMLAEKYTAFESSSITYEKARQLMEAVRYCIREGDGKERHSVAAPGRLSARQAYEAGLARVEEKVKAALELYHEILSGFVWYGNRCLHDTFVKGMPEFFRWYDIRFLPQGTILTLDYPVLRDLSEYTGVDRIYEYLVCIRLEQSFLRKFPEAYVINAQAERADFYQEMVWNLCELAVWEVLEHLLAGRLAEPDSGEEHGRVQALVRGREPEEVRGLVEDAAEIFAAEYLGEDVALRAYLRGAVEEMAVRLEHAAKAR